VLLVDHRPEGALGFVINRPANLTLSGMVEALGLRPGSSTLPDSPVLVGGPVAPDTGWLVFEQPPQLDADEQIVQVTQHIAVSASRELLETIVTGSGPVPAKLLLVLGYAGWGPGQLDAEIEHGAWIPVDIDERIVFDAPYDERWALALRTLGIDPARLTAAAPCES
jgi:putative transcriptional regulator